MTNIDAGCEAVVYLITHWKEWGLCVFKQKCQVILLPNYIPSEQVADGSWIVFLNYVHITIASGSVPTPSTRIVLEILSWFPLQSISSSSSDILLDVSTILFDILSGSACLTMIPIKHQLLLKRKSTTTPKTTTPTTTPPSRYQERRK